MNESELARLYEALYYALDIIDSYRADINNSQWLGIDLYAHGFCQGRIYRDAPTRILRIAEGTDSVIPELRRRVLLMNETEQMRHDARTHTTTR